MRKTLGMVFILTAMLVSFTQALLFTALLTNSALAGGTKLKDVSCSAGDIIRSDGAGYVCSTDADTLGNLSCSNREFPRRDSATGMWVCGDNRVTTYQMIPVSAFQQGSEDDETWDFGNSSSGGGYGVILAGDSADYDVNLFAPVNLPHGATVTEVTAYYYDGDSSSDISRLVLSLAFQGTAANQAMSIIDTSTSGSSTFIQTASDNTISFAQIDNSTNRVWLRLFMKVSFPSFDLRFYGARIKYETSP